MVSAFYIEDLFVYNFIFYFGKEHTSKIHQTQIAHTFSLEWVLLTNAYALGAASGAGVRSFQRNRHTA